MAPQTSRIGLGEDILAVKKPHFFYGWKIVGISFVTLAIAYGIWYSFSVFFVVILSEFGWSRAATAGVFSLFTLVHSFSGFLVGSLLDRFGARRVIPAGSVLIVLGLVLTSQIQSLWQLYLYYGVVTAVGICSIGFISHSIFLPNWFFKKRGLAMGAAMAGIGVGMQIIVPVTQSVIANIGWRPACWLLAGIVITIVVPLNAIVQRKNPEEIGELPDGERKVIAPENLKEENSPSDNVFHIPFVWTLHNSFRTRQFRFLCLTFFFTAFAIQGILIHQVVHIIDKGFSPQQGAFFFGLSGIFGSVGKIFFGHLSDQIGRNRAFSISIGCTFFGVLSLAVLQSGYGWLLYTYAILFGLGYGSIAPIYPARVADLFQGPEFGKIYGLISIAGGLGGALGAWLYGKIFDLTLTYTMAFIVVMLGLVLILVLFYFTVPSSLQEVNSTES